MNRERFELVYKSLQTPFFPLCLIVKAYTTDFHRLTKKRLEPKKVIVIIDKGYVNWFFDNELKKYARYVFKCIFSDPEYLKKIKHQEKQLSKKLLHEIKTPVKTLFNKNNLTKKGQSAIKRIFSYYSLYGLYIDVPSFLFQLYLVDSFRKEVLKSIDMPNKKKNEIFDTLMSSEQKNNYEKLILDIYNNLGKTEKAGKIAAKHYWVIHDYVGNIIDEKYVLDKFKEFNSNKKEIEERLKKINRRIDAIKKIKKKLPTRLQNKIGIIHELNHLYNERKKEVISKVNIYLRRIIEHKFKNISLTNLRGLYQLTPSEIIDLLSNRKISKVKKRNQRYAYIINKEKIMKAPKKYFSLIPHKGYEDILKGLPASAGKTSGRISVVTDINQINKFKRGMILVAPFTGANYLPIMHKAKAILTETGGLTSHAAIVARELKKPCIVGIKGIISLLKDGDLIEVNADKGTVKILKT